MRYLSNVHQDVFAVDNGFFFAVMLLKITFALHIAHTFSIGYRAAAIFLHFRACRSLDSIHSTTAVFTAFLTFCKQTYKNC